MKIYVCNAFSLSMLDRKTQTRAAAEQNRVFQPHGRPRIPLPIENPADWLEEWIGHAEIVSTVGHADTAAIFAAILGRPVPVNRVSVKLTEEDHALVGQYIGPRLPEGATTLPEGARIEWWAI